MAQRLLHIWPVLLLASSTSCVIPIPYGEGDAGLGHTPIIVAAEPAMTSPITIFKSASELYTIDVEDRDIDDLLYVRVFRDDFAVEPIVRAEQLNVPGGTLVRRVGLTANGLVWCSNKAAGEQTNFTVIVSNQPFVGNTDELPDGADSSSKTWIATCLD
jgi:hypothetical protein